MEGTKCLIVGCGDIGVELAATLIASGISVWGLRRDCSALPTSIKSLPADVTDVASLGPLQKMGFDYVVVTLTPGQFSDSAYARTYVDGLENLLAVLPGDSLQKLLFVSSTSVYHQDDGSWVDEDSPTNPQAFSGRRLLQAEQLLAGSGLPATIVRFAGIYGPARNRLLEQVRNGQGCPRQPPVFTNRIHRDDCAGFLAHLLQIQGRGEKLEPCYLGVDSEPAPLWEVKTWLAKQLGKDSGDWQQTIANRRNSKRCSNRRMLASGYKLKYPGYRQGYAALLQQPASKSLL